MFHQLLTDAGWPGDRPAIHAPDGTIQWQDLYASAASLSLSRLRLANRRVGLSFRANAWGLAALAQLDMLKVDVFLFDARLTRDEAVRLARELRLGVMLLEDCSRSGSPWQPLTLDEELAGSGQGSVTILTSGTTGTPKAVRHTWQSLCRPTRRSPSTNGPRWLLTYRPHLYAGLQVLLQCLLNGGTLVTPHEGAAPAAVARLMREAGVEHASATPSYWRRLLLFADSQVLSEVPLTQITLGGEVVDQQILDALKSTFHQARITHIYATTELGRCFSVTDGRAGFPLKYLRESTPDGVELHIDDGELVVSSANRMLGYDAGDQERGDHSGRFRTGDLVQVEGERVFFVGRRTDMINVGGNKVHPLEVERVLRAVPGVADVRVHGKKSSIAGELVCCQIVPVVGCDPPTLRQAISAACLAQLTPVQRPRLIDIVSEISLDPSGKAKRRLTG